MINNKMKCINQLLKRFKNSEHIFPGSNIHGPSPAPLFINETDTTVAQEITNAIGFNEVEFSSGLVAHL